MIMIIDLKKIDHYIKRISAKVYMAKVVKATDAKLEV